MRNPWFWVIFRWMCDLCYQGLLIERCLGSKSPYFIIIIIIIIIVFLGLLPQHMEVPSLGGLIRAVATSLHHSSQQLRIQAASATYITAHGNAGFLTPWARPGIRPKTSWFLVGVVIHGAEPRWELPSLPTLDGHWSVWFCSGQTHPHTLNKHKVWTVVKLKMESNSALDSLWTYH